MLESEPLLINDNQLPRRPSLPSFKMNKQTVYCCSCCVPTLIIVGVILFACSWSYIKPTEYGIPYNKFSGRVVADKVYGSGRYFTGVAKTFIKFPNAYVTVEFSDRKNASSSPVSTRTKDGVQVTISFAFQYYLKEKEITKLYNKFGTAYEAPMIKEARTVVYQTASQYKGTEYWLHRTTIATQMLENLQKTMAPSYYCTVKGFQLLTVQLPKAWEQTIISTQVQEQQRQTQEYNKRVEAINQQILQLYAGADRTVLNIETTANAQAIAIANGAQTAAVNYTQNAMAEAYSDAATCLDLNSTQLLQYMKLRAIRERSEEATYLSIDNPF